MKTLLHLMAKDARALRREILFLWLCLALPLLMTAVFRDDTAQQPMALLTGFDGILSLLAVVTMLSLLLGWIRLDHPKISDGMMATRPVSGLRQWAAKMLLWLLIVALPVMTQILLRLALLRLDLRMEDYLQTAAQVGLLFAAAFGPVALVGGWITHRKLAEAAGCLILLIVGFFWSTNPFSHSDPSLLNSDWVRAIDLAESRRLVGMSVLLAAGFILAGFVFAPRQIRPILTGTLFILGLSGLGWLAWPLPLMSRAPLSSFSEPRQTAQLQASTQVMAGGEIRAVRRKDSKPLYRTSHLTVVQKAAIPTLEWPKTMGYTITYQPDGEPAISSTWIPYTAVQSGFGSSLLDSTTISLTSPDEAPIPADNLIHLLGLPSTLTPAVFVHQENLSPNSRQVAAILQPPTTLDGKAKIRLTGEITCDWLRPSIATELPLSAGATFTRDGRRVRIRSAAVQQNHLLLKFTVTRHNPSPAARNQPFDVDPACLLYIANLKQGQIGLRHSAKTLSSTSAFDGTTVIDVEAIYQIIGTSPAVLNDLWFQEAKLFVVEKHIIGSTQQPFEGEFTVLN